ncbi:AEC family transporter [candidate division WOR-3 bacterium]|nr:AEC family transporter [candidate division WOR-3 bacterium]
MLDILLRMVPFFASFFLGFAAKSLKIIEEKDARTLLKIFFYFIFPFLAFRILHDVEISSNQILLPFVSFTILISLFFVSVFLSKVILSKKIKRSESVAFILAVSIMNTSFIMPFVNEFAGEKGLTSLMIFDIGNMVVIATFLFAFSSYSATRSFGRTAVNLMLSPPIWAVLSAFIFNFFNIKSPAVLDQTLLFLEKPAFPMVLFSLGALLDFKILLSKTAVSAVAMRMILGFAIGFAVINAIDLQWAEKFVVIMAASSPCGFNSVVYSSLHGHDAKTAAASVSLSLLLSLMSLPVLVYIFTK